jgi:tetratricopeptide (TPR) repeat protein
VVGQTDRALDMCYQAIRINSQNPSPYIKTAATLIKQGQPEKAKKYLKKAGTLPISHPSTYHNMGKAYESLNLFS